MREDRGGGTLRARAARPRGSGPGGEGAHAPGKAERALKAPWKRKRPA